MTLQENNHEVDGLVPETNLSDSVLPGDGKANSPVRQHRDWWAWEILGVVGSGIAIVGIVILLLLFDGNPVPSWSLALASTDDSTSAKSQHISFNSILSVLSTIARICLLIPITKGIAQLKWVWLAGEKRKLTDLVDFDAASRQSLVGIFRLVWTLKGRHFAVVASAALITTLGFDFFVQNLVTYPSMPTIDIPLSDSHMARIGNATYYNVEDNNQDPTSLLDSVMTANIWDSLWAIDFGGDWAIPEYFCESGNCTWSDYSSLGVCARCADLTSQLQKNCTHVPGVDPEDVTGCDFSLSDSFSLGGSKRSRSTVMAMSSASAPLVYYNYSAPISIIQSIIAYNTSYVTNSTDVTASECALVPCVINYLCSELDHVTEPGPGVTGRLYYDLAQRIWDNFTLDSEASGPSIILSTDPDEHKLIQYSIGPESYAALKAYIGALLNGYVIANNDEFSYATAGLNSSASINSIGAMQAIYQSFGFCQDLFGNRIWDWDVCSLNWLSIGITKVIRDASFNNVTSEKGDTSFEEPTIIVAWFWIIPTGICWIFSLIILIGTAWKTRRSQVMTWRGDPLALVFLDIDHAGVETVQQYGLTEKDLEKKAKALHVQLRITGNQAQLVGS